MECPHVGTSYSHLIVYVVNQGILCSEHAEQASSRGVLERGGGGGGATGLLHKGGGATGFLV